MLGAGEAYHLEPLARCIKKAAPTCKLLCHGLFSPGEGGTRIKQETSEAFEQVFHSPGKSGKLAPPAATKSLSLLESKKKNLPLWVLGARVMYQTVRRWLQAVPMRREFDALVDGVDVVHLQTLFLGPAHYWILSRPDIPFVVSCWGSDVLRQADLTTTLTQQALLEAASVITVTGVEFKEIVLSKYGRHLEHKIVITYFNPSVDAVFRAGRKMLKSGSAEAKESWRVCIGVNGTRQGNHLAILESLITLPEACKKKIELIIPMTYGASEEYIGEVRAMAGRSGCRYTVIESYMSDTEVMQLRNSTDILVFAPVSDAFSVTVTQALAAGSVIIAGIWLPYKLRRISGFNYHELTDLREAGSVIESVIQNWGEECRVTKNNQQLAGKVFAEKTIGMGWVDAYRKALKSSKASSGDSKNVN